MRKLILLLIVLTPLVFVKAGQNPTGISNLDGIINIDDGDCNNPLSSSTTGKEVYGLAVVRNDFDFDNYTTVMILSFNTSHIKTEDDIETSYISYYIVDTEFTQLLIGATLEWTYGNGSLGDTMEAGDCGDQPFSLTDDIWGGNQDGWQTKEFGGLDFVYSGRLDVQAKPVAALENEEYFRQIIRFGDYDGENYDPKLVIQYIDGSSISIDSDVRFMLNEGGEFTLQ